MSNIEQSKTVFISYRRNVSEWEGLLITRHLRSQGYDVFFDQDSIDNGPFRTFILNQIKQRDHFLLLLEDGTLERCAAPDDWVRLEIETALDLKRNIVPVMINDFDMGAAEKLGLFPGKLSQIPGLNACPLPSPYFFEATMQTLQDRYLKETVKAIPVTETEQELAVQGLQELVVQDEREKESDDIVDTIILRGEPQDVEQYFKQDKRWYPVSIGAQWLKLIDRGVIKYVAIYESDPINAIRFYAEISEVKPWRNQKDQQAIWLSGDIKQFRQHVKRDSDGKERSLNRPRYTSLEKIKQSKTLNDLFNS